MRHPSRTLPLAHLLLLAGLVSAAPLAAQQDQAAKDSAMAHDSAMGKDAMGKDAMAHDSAMGKDAMGKDAMAHDAMAMAPHGTFSGAANHKASGTYEIATAGNKTQLKLGQEFSVDKAPDLYVVLSQSEKVEKSGALWLGKLKQFSGAQTYDIPAGTDLKGYSNIVIWCKKFTVPLAVAALAAGGEMMHK